MISSWEEESLMGLISNEEEEDIFTLPRFKRTEEDLGTTELGRTPFIM